LYLETMTIRRYMYVGEGQTIIQAGDR